MMAPEEHLTIAVPLTEVVVNAPPEELIVRSPVRPPETTAPPDDMIIAVFVCNEPSRMRAPPDSCEVRLAVDPSPSEILEPPEATSDRLLVKSSPMLIASMLAPIEAVREMGSLKVVIVAVAFGGPSGPAQVVLALLALIVSKPWASTFAEAKRNNQSGASSTTLCTEPTLKVHWKPDIQLS
eukprot:gnl/TRDRNA2_/TRDRNA2_33485_c0_seq1.p2 gnl/TRDRNA2_/TRDRNA2_33485_c0~~gnl/TRDRNA2_/TRDRNA2_33485_c0_seq1.p2  ORF type:complete len:182 (-),score=35.60 gnl/TRDRNA2_/TRDRNA2_33485_c0_seq1:401-946(-)